MGRLLRLRTRQLFCLTKVVVWNIEVPNRIEYEKPVIGGRGAV